MFDFLSCLTRIADLSNRVDGSFAISVDETWFKGLEDDNMVLPVVEIGVEETDAGIEMDVGESAFNILEEEGRVMIEDEEDVGIGEKCRSSLMLINAC